MRKIGNILTDKKFYEGGVYNVTSSKDGLIKGIPTLVIGWEFVKSNYPDANIIDWQIDNDTFWTFGSRERRSAYEKRLQEFKDIAVDRFIKSVKYVPFNILVESAESKKELFGIFDSVDYEKEVYFKNDMVYIYLPKDETVYGISFRDVEYIGKDLDKFIHKMYTLPNSEFVNKSIDKNIENEALVKFRNSIYMIPCLLYNNV